MSTLIIRDNQVIVMEDLRVKNMMQNHKLAKAISEVSWSMFRSMREWMCSSCQTVHDRVRNAALNLLKLTNEMAYIG